MLPIFSSTCSTMFPTTYPKIAASGIETQPGSDPSWLLPRVYTHSLHMIEILILFLLYYDIFSMHWPHHSVFPDVLTISAGAFTEFDHDATRNVIGAQSATPRPFIVKVLWSPGMVNFRVNHHVNLMPHMHTSNPVHTSNQFLGMLTPFPSRSCKINHICLIFPPLHWLNPTKA
jgi:hypothetical protein